MVRSMGKPALDFFSADQVSSLTGLSLRQLNYWWRTGFYVSLANIFIWLTAGFAWWKFLGFW